MKSIAVFVVVLLIAVGFTFSYRAYKERTEADLAARRSQLEERNADSRRKEEATREAQRLTALQADQAATEADQKLEVMRQEQAAAELQRKQAEAEVARLNLELEDLRRQKDATVAMMEKTAEQRQAEL